MNFETFVLAIFVLAALTSTGVLGNTYCYECRNVDRSNEACLDPMNSNVPVNSCGSGYVCTTLTYVYLGKFITTRSCARETYNTCATIETDISPIFAGGGGLSSFTCDTCQTDYCNSKKTNFGVALVVSLLTVLCGALFVKIL